MQTVNRRPNGKFVKGNTLGRRWTRGESGNPAGRPLTGNLGIALRRSLLETMPGNSEKSIAVAVAEALIRKALNGDVQAIKEIFDRVEGKASQSIDMELSVTDWQTVIREHGISEEELLDAANRLLTDGTDDESTAE